MDIRKAFGQQVKDLRLECGLTQEQLAERAELHPNYIGQVERGQKNVSLENIQKIAQGLRVELPVLLHFTEKPSNLTLDQIHYLLQEFIEEDQSFVLRHIEEMARWMKSKMESGAGNKKEPKRERQGNGTEK